MTALSEFREVLRILLGDTDSEGLYLHSNDTLDAAVRTVFRLGRAPGGYTLTGVSIEPEVGSSADFARISIEAALLLVAPAETQNIRTRALSVSRAGDGKRDLLYELRSRLDELNGGGDNVASSQDVVVWLHSTIGGCLPRRASGAAATPSPSTESRTATGLIGDGVETVWDVTHGLNREGIVASLERVSSGEYLVADIRKLDLNRIRITFTEAPAAESVRWTVIAA